MTKSKKSLKRQIFNAVKISRQQLQEMKLPRNDSGFDERVNRWIPLPGKDLPSCLSRGKLNVLVL